MGRQRYRSDEVRHACASAYHIDEAKQRLVLSAGGLAWTSHVAYALSYMTKPDELHLAPKENDGVHYKPNHERIRAYMAAHPSGSGDDRPLNPYAEFIAVTKDMLRGTEVERPTIQRIGQDIFRKHLIRTWDCRCAVTEIDDADLLRASHIKPWASCDNDHERLNVDNGLLLAAHIDAAFDAGLISFSDRGDVILSPKLSIENIKRLGLDRKDTVQIPMSPARAGFMQWHRRHFGL